MIFWRLYVGVLELPRRCRLAPPSFLLLLSSNSFVSLIKCVMIDDHVRMKLKENSDACVHAHSDDVMCRCVAGAVSSGHVCRLPTKCPIYGSFT